MKNTIGNAITITLFGESHGEAIGAVIDGIAPGIKVDFEYISEKMAKRRPGGEFSTQRKESDAVRFLSGIFNGYTTGTPIAFIIENDDTRSQDYKSNSEIPRPSHADLTAEYKYHGFQDFRGGGHFSGRLTAPIVAAGALLESALNKKGVTVASRIYSLGGIYDEGALLPENAKAVDKKAIPTVSDEKGEMMLATLKDAKESGDSVGGIIEAVAFGVPQGVGEPCFDSLESVLSHLAFSIPAVKGVEFGKGFSIADMKGSEANDAYLIDGGKIVTATNNNGGIIGGITNGMPIVMRTALKPTPSIYKTQKSVNKADMTEVELTISGRHDPTVVIRARAVVEAVMAIGLADMLTARYGTDYLGEDS